MLMAEAQKSKWKQSSLFKAYTQNWHTVTSAHILSAKASHTAKTKASRAKIWWSRGKELGSIMQSTVLYKKCHRSSKSLFLCYLGRFYLFLKNMHNEKWGFWPSCSSKSTNVDVLVSNGVSHGAIKIVNSASALPLVSLNRTTNIWDILRCPYCCKKPKEPQTVTSFSLFLHPSPLIYQKWINSKNTSLLLAPHLYHKILQRQGYVFSLLISLVPPSASSVNAEEGGVSNNSYSISVVDYLPACLILSDCSLSGSLIMAPPCSLGQ